MSFTRGLLQVIALVCLASLGLSEQSIDSIITGYGYASSSNTLSTGAQGSEHSATYNDPGDCATNVNVYPIGTLIYVVGLQKYFSVQDSCGDCSSESQPHFDLWMGVPSYSNKAQLTQCADGITVSNPTAAVIINPNSGYHVDPTPLMSSTGVCDTNADYSRTQPVSAGGGPTGGNTNGSPMTLSTVVSPATPSASTGAGSNSKSSSKSSTSNTNGSGRCGWRGHCRGAPCQTSSDCADPFSCVNSDEANDFCTHPLYWRYRKA